MFFLLFRCTVYGTLQYELTWIGISVDATYLYHDKQNKSPNHLFPVIYETVLEEGLKADPGKVLPHGEEQVQVLVQVRIELDLWGAARKQEHYI